MLLMDYLSIKGEEIPDHAKNTIWNPLHACKDAHSHIIISEYEGDGVQEISSL